MILIFRFALLASVFLLAVQQTDAQESAREPERLTELKMTYSDALAKIRESRTAEENKVARSYLEALKQLENNLKAKGDLENLLEVRKEITRFEDEKSITSDRTPGFEAVILLRTKYADRLKAAPLEEASKIVTLATQYDAALEELQKEFTKADRIAEALMVKEERNALSNDAVVKAARFTIAESKAAMPPPRIVAPAKENENGRNDETAAVEPVKQYTGSAKNRVRRRFLDLCDEILEQNWEEAVKYVDPEFVKQRGKSAVTAALQSAFLFLRFTDRPDTKLDTAEISVEDDQKTARLVPQVWLKSRWEEGNALFWKECQGDWHLDLSRHIESGAVPAPIRPRRFWRR